MKKILLYVSVLTSVIILMGCANKKEVAPEPVYDDLPITSGDVTGIDTLIGGTRYATDESDSSFTFKGDQSFFVDVAGNQVFGKWIISEGEILLGEQGRTLDILGDNEIQIENIVYERESE